ncbi:MAG: histidinol-phosphate transaminase, partial [Alphaproteobacteria bacterium CG11_big_fil_rev_8_21_14_0_20_44_7]
DAVQNAASLNRYPDGASSELREKLGEINNLNPEQIICGAGSDEILELIAYAYCGEGDEVIYTQHGFLVYPIAAMSAGAKPIAVAEKNLTADVDTILAAVNERTRIVMLANPNNPTGTYISGAELKRLRADLREDILLVIDNAYAECVTADDYDMGYDLADAAPNTIITRTFSKMYGIPALRVGWGYAAPEIIDILNRIRPPFNLTTLGQVGACAALDDVEFMQKSVAHNTKWREWLSAELRGLGCEVPPSQGNFVLAKFADANAVFEKLRANDIIVREMGGYGLPEYLRISIGLEADMKKLVALLGE